MKKRQRKKFYKGEFQELGFELDFHYNVETDEEEFTLLDEFFNTLHHINLTMGGGYGNDGKAAFFITTAERGSVSPENRQAVIDWLTAHNAIDDIHVGELEDAWYHDDF